MAAGDDDGRKGQGLVEGYPREGWRRTKRRRPDALEQGEVTTLVGEAKVTQGV